MVGWTDRGNGGVVRHRVVNVLLNFGRAEASLEENPGIFLALTNTR